MGRSAWTTVFLVACVAPPVEPDPPVPAPIETPPLPSVETSNRRTAMVLEVPSVPEALARLEEALAVRGGYETRRVFPESRPDGRVSAWIEFQVDLRQAKALEDLLDRMGTRIAGQQEVSDATESMVETNARLAALRETEARLRRSLSDPGLQCAERVAAETEHGRVLAEISALGSRLKVLEFRAQYGAFAVRLVEPGPPPRESEGSRSLLGRVPAAWTRVVKDPSGALADGVVSVLASLPWILAVVLARRALGRIRVRRRDGPAGRPGG